MSLFPVYPLFEITPVSSNGMYVYNKNGDEYLDLYGGHAVISIGHSHPKYVEALQDQLSKIGFYSNSVINDLQIELGRKLTESANCDGYQLFMCNSGAEANENALKLASFYTGKSQVLAFRNSFHGRTSAAVAATDNPKIIAPINAQQEVEFIDLGDLKNLELKLKSNKACAVILEIIQGVGGLDESTSEFYKGVQSLCKKYEALLVVDEVQSGFGRTGDFFAFQAHGINPDIISIAKGMGNGFPVGGILIHPHIEGNYGMLGTTFGGNHLACRASLAVLEVLEDEQLMQNAHNMSAYLIQELNGLKGMKSIKGRGLMIGLEFDFNVKPLRESLVYKYRIFTGNSKNPNLLRILPPLIIEEKHIDHFVNAIKNELYT